VVLVRVLIALAPSGLPRIGEATLDGLAVAVALSLVVLSLGAFGVAPALRAVRTDLRAGLSATRGGSGRRSNALRRVLVVSQLSLAGLLAIGAGTMTRTLGNLYRVDLGFRPEQTLTLSLAPDFNRYSQPEEVVAFYAELVPRLEAIPGVRAVGAHLTTPFGGERGNWSLSTEDQPAGNVSEAPDAFVQIATPGYFDAMGVELLSGRLFTSRDRADATPVVVINEALARTLWPGEPPLGKRFKVFPEGWPYAEVIGVVADVRHLSADQPGLPRFYAPHAQAYQSFYFSPLGVSITLRTDGDPTTFAAGVRSAIAEIDPTAPVSDVRTMEDRVAASVSNRRFVTTLLQAFGSVALLLAAIGVYGVMSLMVNERSRELGLRKALGAQGTHLVGAVLRESLALAAAGAGLAVVGGITFGRLVQSVLFEASPTDPATLAVVGLTLVSTAFLAALVPARRASRVDPMEVLRAEG